MLDLMRNTSITYPLSCTHLASQLYKHFMELMHEPVMTLNDTILMPLTHSHLLTNCLYSHFSR